MGVRVSYDDYRSRPEVRRVVRAGFPERDVRRVYVRVVPRDMRRGEERGRIFDNR